MNTVESSVTAEKDETCFTHTGMLMISTKSRLCIWIHRDLILRCITKRNMKLHVSKDRSRIESNMITSNWKVCKFPVMVEWIPF